MVIVPDCASSKGKQSWLPAAKYDDMWKGYSAVCYCQYSSLIWTTGLAVYMIIHIRSGKTLWNENTFLFSCRHAAHTPRPPARLSLCVWDFLAKCVHLCPLIRVFGNANVLQYFPTENHTGDTTKRFHTLRQGDILTANFSDMKVLKIIPYAMNQNVSLHHRSSQKLSAKEKIAFSCFRCRVEFLSYFLCFRIRIFNLTVSQKGSMLTSVPFYNNLLFNNDLYYIIFHFKVKTNVNINL